LFMTHISGKTLPIDTILLGPVDPQVRLELQKQTKTIENEIANMVTAAQVREIQVPAGSIDIFTPDGEKTSLSGPYSATNDSTTTPIAPTAPAPSVPTAPSTKPGAITTKPTIGERDATGRVVSGWSKQSDGTYLVRYKEEDKDRGSSSNDSSGSSSAAPTAPAPVLKGFRGRTLGSVISGASLRVHEIVRVNTPGTRLNVRSAPGTDSAILTKLNDKTQIGVRGSIERKNGVDWLPIYYADADGSKSGYVALDYVEAL
jgi:hypothetical protein